LLRLALLVHFIGVEALAGLLTQAVGLVHDVDGGLGLVSHAIRVNFGHHITAVVTGIHAHHVHQVGRAHRQPNFSMTLSTRWKSTPMPIRRAKPPKYGKSTRLTRKPGQSLTTIGVLPIFLAYATVVAMAFSLDFSPRMT